MTILSVRKYGAITATVASLSILATVTIHRRLLPALLHPVISDRYFMAAATRCFSNWPVVLLMALTR
jgi:hypothetical protein